MAAAPVGPIIIFYFLKKKVQVLISRGGGRGRQFYEQTPVNRRIHPCAWRVHPAYAWRAAFVCDREVQAERFSWEETKCTHAEKKVTAEQHCVHNRFHGGYLHALKTKWARIFSSKVTA